MRGELRGEKRGKIGGEGPEGWTMAAALITYKKGIQRKEDIEKGRQAQRGESGKGASEAREGRQRGARKRRRGSDGRANGGNGTYGKQEAASDGDGG